jgi:hypothetical protein
MPSTYSTNLRFELIASGEQAGLWGGTTNTNIGTLIEQAISGTSAVVMANADYSLTTANGASDQARCMYLSITSSATLTTTRTVTCPAVSKFYVVRNGTTGSQSIVFTAGGTGVTIPNGETVTVMCDATNVFAVISGIVIAVDNTALGRSALAANTTGTNNVAVGRNALLLNTTGASNVAVGALALDRANTLGELERAARHLALPPIGAASVSAFQRAAVEAWAERWQIGQS